MKRYLGVLVAILVAGTSATVRGQQPGPASQQPQEIPAQYPPQQGGPDQAARNDPGAARVSYIHGDVSTQRGDTGEWVAATLNTPVVTGDHVATGRDSRAEVQLDNANILRMSGESTANIANFTQSQVHVQIGKGLVTYDILRGSEADVQIDTPNASIHPSMGEGTYRITVNSDSETIVDVRKGSAEISTPQGSTHVENNQRITVAGTDNTEYQIADAARRDDWDNWNNDRDRVISSAQSWQHTNPYYVGSQDLDAYGHWEHVPDYDDVWIPTAADGWAPYRDGRWVWEPYYGWTWVSYEPWGWAPYHYGRWFVYGGSWCWWPGPVRGGYRPIWAPAYVSFIGFGGGRVSFGAGFGFGNVGWLAIGPGDRFHPWYGRGVTQVNVVNIYNVHNDRGGFEPLRTGPRGFSNIDRAFTDDRVRGGVSSMRAEEFGRGRVPSSQPRIDAGTLRQGGMLTAAMPVTPSRESMRPSDRPVNPSSIPRSTIAQQRFFDRSARIAGQQPQAVGASRGGPAAISNQPNASRPGFRTFGGSRNNGSTGASPAQTAQPPVGIGRRDGGPTPPTTQSNQAPQQQPPATSARGGGWRNYTPPSSSQSQPTAGARGYETQGRPAQPNTAQPEPPARQAQPYSHGVYGGSRPPLQVQPPIVTPRSEGTYSGPRAAPPERGGSGRGGSAPAPRSAPSGGSSGERARGSSSSSGDHGSGGHHFR